jgi:hypothetical protein
VDIHRGGLRQGVQDRVRDVAVLEGVGLGVVENGVFTIPGSISVTRIPVPRSSSRRL